MPYIFSTQSFSNSMILTIGSDPKVTASLVDIWLILIITNNCATLNKQNWVIINQRFLALVSFGCSSLKNLKLRVFLDFDFQLLLVTNI